MHLRNKPPIFVPREYRAEIEKLSKAALMDLAWDFVAASDVGEGDEAIMARLRERIEIVLTHRNQEPRQ